MGNQETPTKKEDPQTGDLIIPPKKPTEAETEDKSGSKPGTKQQDTD